MYHPINFQEIYTQEINFIFELINHVIALESISLWDNLMDIYHLKAETKTVSYQWNNLEFKEITSSLMLRKV